MTRVNLQQILDKYESERFDISDAREFFKILSEKLDSRLKDDKKTLLEAVSNIEKKNNSSIERTTSAIGSDLRKEIKAIQKLAEDTLKKVNKALREQENGMSFIYDKVAALRDGENASPEAVAEIVLSRIEKGMSEEESQKMQELIEAIEELKEIYEKGTRSTTIPAVTPVLGRNFIKDVDISSQLDGVKKTFNIGAFHSILNVFASSHPYALRKGIDYTTNGSTGDITFTDEIVADATLSAGQTLIITLVVA